MSQIGQHESPLQAGLRDHSMRTPIQFQQNFPREVAMSEAAALAGIDALQFRIDQTSEPRIKDILARLRDASGMAIASVTQSSGGRRAANGSFKVEAYRSSSATTASGPVRLT